MKISVFFGVLWMLLAVFSPAQAVEEPELRKTYVELSQLAFADQGIFAHVEGEWIPVHGVHADSRCLYVAHSKYPRSRWICRVCGYNNYGGHTVCQKEDEVSGKLCGAPRPPG